MNEERYDWNDSQKVVNACVFTGNSAAVALGLMTLGLIEVIDTIAKTVKWAYCACKQRHEDRKAARYGDYI